MRPDPCDRPLDDRDPLGADMGGRFRNGRVRQKTQIGRTGRRACGMERKLRPGLMRIDFARPEMQGNAALRRNIPAQAADALILLGAEKA